MELRGALDGPVPAGLLEQPFGLQLGAVVAKGIAIDTDDGHIDHVPIAPGRQQTAHPLEFGGLSASRGGHGLDDRLDAVQRRGQALTRPDVTAMGHHSRRHDRGSLAGQHANLVTALHQEGSEATTERACPPDDQYLSHGTRP